MTRNRHARARRSAGIVTATGLLLAIPVAAQAHVTVNPNTAVAGSYATLVFKVPTEKAGASTIRVEVDLPTDHPFTAVSYQPVAGWTTTITTAKLPRPVKEDGTTITAAPTKVVWTATKGTAIEPGQFQQFPVSVGVVPSVPSVSFVAKQTYSDGSVVVWDQPTKPGRPEPEHPAPVLTIGAASSSADPSSSAPTVAASAPQSSTGDSGAGVWFGVAGIAVGAVALLVALYAATRRAR